MKKTSPWNRFLFRLSIVDCKESLNGLSLAITVVIFIASVYFNQEINHSLTGSRMISMNYEIKYIYSVDEKVHSKSALIINLTVIDYDY